MSVRRKKGSGKRRKSKITRRSGGGRKRLVGEVGEVGAVNEVQAEGL